MGGAAGGATGGTGGAGGGGGTTGGGAAMTPADAQAEIARLRAEVNRLQTELDNTREARGEATGGSGTGGSGKDLDNIPVASAELVGRVRVVSAKQVEVVDHETGDTYVLSVDKNTRASAPVSAFR